MIQNVLNSGKIIGFLGLGEKIVQGFVNILDMIWKEKKKQFRYRRMLQIYTLQNINHLFDVIVINKSYYC